MMDILVIVWRRVDVLHLEEITLTTWMSAAKHVSEIILLLYVTVRSIRLQV